MVKQIILLFNLFSMSFVTFLFSDGIEITSNLPTELVRDSTYIVEVNIKKGELFGFAKYQQNFPAGYIAKPVNTEEASFTFADGKVKFIWMAIPEKGEVNISYALTATADAPDESLVGGKFWYISDNERKSYDMSNQTIRVISEEDLAPPAPPATAAVDRSVKDLGNNTYEVELSIAKDGVYGFGKLEEYLPVGAEAEVMVNNKAVFSQVDEKAKFVWMSIPEDEVLKISYRVSATSDITSELETMEGNFAFLDNNETKTVAIMGAPVDEVASSIAQSEETETIDVPEVVEEPEVEAPQVEVAQIEETQEEVAQIEETREEVEEIAQTETEKPVETFTPSPQAEPVASNEPEITSIPDPESGVMYRVQILAGHKMVSKDFVSKKYSYSSNFLTENHEGWIKYITGEYGVYKQARDKREDLVAANHNFPGPFVTAYNDGQRITVQEALMISNQKWFK